ncbi:MAG: hypothetical protein Q4D81_08290 [Eubacteriales bacterium]|nr:hypothetical protein [Eubacteriales bacterium]
MNTHMEKRTRWSALRTWMYTAVAVMLVLGASMGTAWAYFTTYATAKGGVTLHMGHEEKVEESFSNNRKTINIESTADSQPVYIRARGFYKDPEGLSYSESQNWTAGEDGWIYYTKILQPGTSLADSGDQLVVKITFPADAKEGDTVNVIIVYETTEVQYNEAGEPLASTDADWTRKVDTNRESTTLGGE